MHSDSQRKSGSLQTKRSCVDCHAICSRVGVNWKKKKERKKKGGGGELLNEMGRQKPDRQRSPDSKLSIVCPTVGF